MRILSENMAANCSRLYMVRSSSQSGVAARVNEPESVTLDETGESAQARRIATGKDLEARGRCDKPGQQVKLLGSLSPVKIPVHVGILHKPQQRLSLRNGFDRRRRVPIRTFVEKKDRG